MIIALFTFSNILIKLIWIIKYMLGQNKLLLFPGMRATREIFTRLVVNCFLLIDFPEIFSFFLWFLLLFLYSCLFVACLFYEIKNIHSDVQWTMRVGE